MRFSFFKRQELDVGYPIFGITIVILLVLIAFPFCLLIVRSFIYEDSYSLTNYQAVFAKRVNYYAFFNTIYISLLTVIFAVLVGAPLAWLVTRTDLPYKSLFRTLFSIPYMIPPFIGAMAWIQLLNPRVGYLNKFLMALFYLDQPIFNIHSLLGLVWVMGLHFYPFVFITTAGGLERMDPTLEEAARISGAGTFKVMRDVTLPLVAPSIAAGALLTFVATTANFGIPALIGMQARIYVLTTRIFAYLYTGEFGGVRLATALSMILLLTSTTGLLFNNLYLRKKQYTIIAGKSMRPQIAQLGPWMPFILTCACLMIVLIVIAPITSVFITSLLRAWGVGVKWSNLTLSNFRYVLFEDELTMRALGNSLKLALSAATITIVIGSLVAYIKVKTKIPGRNLLDSLATLPYAIPGTVVALAMILAWSGKYKINLYNTFWIILVAYIVRYMSFAVRTTSSSMEQIHPSLEEAARVSRANWLQTFKDIIIPLIMPGIVAGWFLIFMPCLRELTISVLLYGPGTETIGVAIFDLQEAGYFQISAALAAVILLVVLLGNWLVKKLTKGRFGL